LLRGARADGVVAGVFGDIDIDRHRLWEEQVCRAANIHAYVPLWQADRRALLDEWWQAGFEAVIVAVRAGVVDRRYLGRTLDAEIADEFERQGIDACGENGEFHTLVTAGPLFSAPLPIELGDQVERGGCWFQDVSVS
jgi:diphthine-ammonia ligase